VARRVAPRIERIKRGVTRKPCAGNEGEQDEEEREGQDQPDAPIAEGDELTGMQGTVSIGGDNGGI
jgi:hypothetical protein